MEILNGYVTLDLGVDELKTTPQKVNGLHDRFVELIKLKKPIMVTPFKISPSFWTAGFIQAKYSNFNSTIYFTISPVQESANINTNNSITFTVSVDTSDNIKYTAVRFVEQA